LSSCFKIKPFSVKNCAAFVQQTVWWLQLSRDIKVLVQGPDATCPCAGFSLQTPLCVVAYHHCDQSAVSMLQPNTRDFHVWASKPSLFKADVSATVETLPKAFWRNSVTSWFCIGCPDWPIIMQAWTNCQLAQLLRPSRKGEACLTSNISPQNARCCPARTSCS
jgi:hypothetical protein